MLQIELPFSKSEINRLFILAFQTKQDFLIQNFSFCDDTKVIYDFYHQIGVKLVLQNNDLMINSYNQHFESLNIVNVHQAGTAFRFLLSLCSTLPYKFQFIGHESLAKRPIKTLTNALKNLNVKFNFQDSQRSLPVEFTGTQLIHTDRIYFQDKILSSQFLSSILLMGPSLPLNFKIFIENDEWVSESYFFMTLKMMEKLGIIWNFDYENHSFTLVKNNFEQFNYYVSADWTNASYFIALSCILKIPIILPKLSILSYQPDVEQLFYWTELGVQFRSMNEQDLEVNPNNFSLKSFDWDFSSTPDLFQTFAVLTVYNKGTYQFRGLQTLQHKETHRLLAIKNELMKIGIQMDYDEKLGQCTIINYVDDFPKEIQFNTYQDHRMAMALSLLKPLIPNIIFDDEKVVNKSFPNYWIEFNKFFNYYN